jgi:hypothetical protein
MDYTRHTCACNIVAARAPGRTARRVEEVEAKRYELSVFLVSLYPYSYSAEHLHNHLEKIASTSTTRETPSVIPRSALMSLARHRAARRWRGKSFRSADVRWGEARPGCSVSAPVRALRFNCNALRPPAFGWPRLTRKLPERVQAFDISRARPPLAQGFVLREKYSRGSSRRSWSRRDAVGQVTRAACVKLIDALASSLNHLAPAPTIALLC